MRNIVACLRPQLLLIALSSGPLLVSCGGGGGLTGAGPTAASQASPEPGVRYFLPRDLIIVEGAITVTRTRKIRADLTLEAPSVSTLNTEARFSRRTVADDSLYYYLHLTPASTKDGSLIVSVGPAGLLQTVGVDVKDKTGEAIVGIAKAAGTVLGSIFLRDVTTPTVEALERLFLKTRAAKLSGDERAKAFDDLRSLPMPVLLTLQDRTDAREMWDSRRDYLKQASGLRALKLKRLETFAAKEAEAAKVWIPLMDEAIRDLETRAKGLSDGLAALTVAYTSEQKVSTPAEVQKFTTALDISELPAESVLSNVELADTTAIIKALSSTLKAQELFRRGLVVITGRRVDPLPGAKVDTGAIPTGGGTPIYYRQPRTYQIRVYAFTRALDPITKDQLARLRLMDEQIVELVARGDPVFALSFPSKSFSDGKLTVAFNEFGRLTRAEQSSTARLAAFANTAASASMGLRDEIASSVKKAQEIEESRRALALSSIKRQVDSLTSAKQVLTLSTEIQGGANTSALEVQRKTLEAQLALLQAQANLDTAQQTSGTRVDNAALQAQVDQLKIQVELLKQQMELSRLQRESNSNTQ